LAIRDDTNDYHRVSANTKLHNTAIELYCTGTCTAMSHRCSSLVIITYTAKAQNADGVPSKE